MKSICITLLLLITCGFVSAQSDSAEQRVRELYDMITFPKNVNPDWEKVRTFLYNLD